MQKSISLSRSYLNISPSGYRYQRKYGTYAMPSIKNGGFLLIILMLAFAISAIAFYIFQMNLSVQQNYQIRELENKLSILQSENQRLSVDSLVLENSQVLTEEAKYLGMETNDKVSYIKVFTPTFVRK